MSWGETLKTKVNWAFTGCKVVTKYSRDIKVVKSSIMFPQIPSKYGAASYGSGASNYTALCIVLPSISTSVIRSRSIKTNSLCERSFWPELHLPLLCFSPLNLICITLRNINKFRGTVYLKNPVLCCLLVFSNSIFASTFFLLLRWERLRLARSPPSRILRLHPGTFDDIIRENPNLYPKHPSSTESIRMFCSVWYLPGSLWASYCMSWVIQLAPSTGVNRPRTHWDTYMTYLKALSAREVHRRLSLGKNNGINLSDYLHVELITSGHSRHTPERTAVR